MSMNMHMRVSKNGSKSKSKGKARGDSMLWHEQHVKASGGKGMVKSGKGRESMRVGMVVVGGSSSDGDEKKDEQQGHGHGQ